MTHDRKKAMRTLREHALGLPGAHEDFPWGESVAKVGKKVFVFLGRPGDEGPQGMSVKLPESGEAALDLPFATPTGYGLGKSGWVSLSFEKGDEIPVELLRDWITESYRAVAPKTMVAKLGEAAASAAPRKAKPPATGAKKPVKRETKPATRATKPASETKPPAKRETKRRAR